MSKFYSPELPWRPRVSPPSVEDKDACAIYASVRRDATPSHEPVTLALESLQKMLHRAGNVDGEGDGCGLLVDIPTKIWAEEIRQGGHNPSLALDDAFAVAHVFVERSADLEKVRHDAREILGRGGFRILAERVGAVDSAALGPTAREEEPHFWQLAGVVADAENRDRTLFELMVELEERLGVHVPSFSGTTCVYKVMGAPKVLGAYYPDLSDERFETVGCFGHNRYSTNTWPSFRRVQPFGVLGHNGEINTIEQLRQEARMLGVHIPEGNSDSQDLNRTIETLCRRYDLSLGEAMELIVPPIVDEIEKFPADLRAFYVYLRQVMGPFAQGPVALIARHHDECVFSADALGLRPLWQVSTPDDYVFSSEQGVVSVERMVDEPKPLAPGEKFMVTIDRDKRASKLWSHEGMLHEVRRRWLERTDADEVAPYDRALETGGPLEGPEIPGYTAAGPADPVQVEDRITAGFGWQRDDVKLVQQMASNGAEPIGSLGYDGPLAALSPERQNLADYFKETVAVVTNPAIDREREIEHFSTRAVFGRRPQFTDPSFDTGTIVTDFPVILGGHHNLAPLSDSAYRKIANEHGTFVLEDLWQQFRDRVGEGDGNAKAIDIALLESETTQGAIERLKQEAVKAVQAGAELLVLTDRTVYDGERRYLDPHLATSAIDQALKTFNVEHGEENLRRRCSLVLRSAAIRNVHDVVLALGLGANGVCPYVMVEVICVDDYENDVGEPLRRAAQGDREGDLDDRDPRGARLRAPVLLDRDQARARRDLPDGVLRREREGRHRLRPARRRHRRAPQDPERRRGVEARQDLPLLPQGLQGRDRRGQRHIHVRGVLAEGSRPRVPEPDLHAPPDGAEVRPRPDRRLAGRRVGRPPRLPGRDQLDELRLAVGAGVPRLRRGGEAHQHPLHQRGGRGDPGHVREVPQVARAAGRLGPLRRLGRDAQLARTSPRSRSARARSPARAATCPARRSPRRSPPRVTPRPAPT